MAEAGRRRQRGGESGIPSTEKALMPEVGFDRCLGVARCCRRALAEAALAGRRESALALDGRQESAPALAGLRGSGDGVFGVRSFGLVLELSPRARAYHWTGETGRTPSKSACVGDIAMLWSAKTVVGEALRGEVENGNVGDSGILSCSIERNPDPMRVRTAPSGEVLRRAAYAYSARKRCAGVIEQPRNTQSPKRSSLRGYGATIASRFALVSQLRTLANFAPDAHPLLGGGSER